MSVASVESLLFRARRRLRVSLKPLATGAITVPVAVREGVAEAIPAFATGGAAGGGTAASAVGLGVLAKFASGPATVKAVASVAAAIAAGSIAAAGVEHRQTPPRNRVAAAPVHAVAPAGDRAASASSTAHECTVRDEPSPRDRRCA